MKILTEVTSSCANILGLLEAQCQKFYIYIYIYIATPILKQRITASVDIKSWIKILNKQSFFYLTVLIKMIIIFSISYSGDYKIRPL